MVSQILFTTISYKLPGIAESRSINYYLPEQYGTLRRDLLVETGHLLPLFGESYEYEDHFSCAEYQFENDSFDESELKLFPAPQTPGQSFSDQLAQIHPRDTFNTCCKIIQRRLQAPDLRLTRSAIELFNEVMEASIPKGDKSGPFCWIQLQTAQQFADPFVQHLLSAATQPLAKTRRMPSPEHPAVQDTFRPLSQLLEHLALSTRQPGWPKNDLEFGKLLLIVDLYRQVKDAQE